MTRKIVWIDDRCMAEGAFLLLSCSTTSRYVRMAGRLAAEAGIGDRIRSGAVTLEEAIQRARNLVRQLNRKSVRGAEEIELAAILAAVWIMTGARVSALLCDLAMIERPALAWIAALARRLYQARPRTSVSTRVTPPSFRNEIYSLIDIGGAGSLTSVLNQGGPSESSNGSQIPMTATDAGDTEAALLAA